MDRPISFSGPMVRALLAGTKTQTRRTISGVPMFSAEYDRQWSPHVLRPGGAIPDKWSWWEGPSHGPSCYHIAAISYAKCDRLWVREAWRAQEAFDGLTPKEIGAEFAAEHGEPWCPTFFEADQRCDGSSVEMWQQSPPGRLRSYRFMPRWASRLTLTVTDVRVRRLQKCSAEDARAEGIHISGPDVCVYRDNADQSPEARRRFDAYCIREYSGLWDRINGKRPGCTWADNPWVVAVGFNVHHGNIDALPTPSASRIQGEA